MRLFDLTECLKYERSTTSGGRYKGIRKLELLAKTQLKIVLNCGFA